MIVPKTFRKESIKRRLDSRLILEKDEDVTFSFCSKGGPCDVPCCFMCFWISKEGVVKRKAAIDMRGTSSLWKKAGVLCGFREWRQRRGW